MSIKGLLIIFICVFVCFGDQTIVSKKVGSAPIVDGKGSDAVWSQATEYTSYDPLSKVTFTIKTIYTKKEVFFLISFPDKDKSVQHKTWVWDKGKEMYTKGNDREDALCLKFNMMSNPVDIRLGDDEYMTDLWFWKACRSNPAGYLDDKTQQLSKTKLPKSSKVTSTSGKTMYLIRKGDAGKSSYKSKILADYQGDEVPAYDIRKPQGSRADVKGTGIWSNGVWTIEISRKLNTGHSDDVTFVPGKVYQFGISRYEIAGKKRNSTLTEPLFNSGEISEILTLKFK